MPSSLRNDQAPSQNLSARIRENVTLLRTMRNGSLIPTFPQIPHSMRIIAWNCRGAARPEFVNVARDLIARYNPHFFIIMETRMHADRAAAMVQRLQFTDNITISSVGFA
ncbi:hypothetical protein ACP275_07G088100 [Erythranthe tilingii]